MFKTRSRILLVVLVVVVFLQSWRASIIPLLAVPVSLIGTFGAMYALGFSLNNLSFFGIVLAIGIVVDDAIVVVENVERNIALGLSPHAATYKAMDEVSGAVVAVGLVLCAVFVPTAFISGITGQFYRQFALTISFSTLLSAFNSLTLSPALAALILKPHKAEKDWLTKGVDFLLGWFFRLFNTGLEKVNAAYVATLRHVVRLSFAVLVVYAGLLVLTYFGFKRVPIGFIPQQDQGYLIAAVQLPDASSLDRTDAVLARMSAIGLKNPAVEGTLMTFPPDPRKRPEAAAVVKAFEAKKFNPEAYTLYSYAAVEIIAAAAAEAKTLDPKKIAETIKNGKPWPTVIGDLAFDKKGDITRPDYVMYTWKKGADGKTTYVQN